MTMNVKLSQSVTYACKQPFQPNIAEACAVADWFNFCPVAGRGKSARFPIYVTLKQSPVVRALALRSGDPGFKTRSDHSLNLFLVVPGSTSQLHL